jgi:hypothetical protein
MNVCIVNDADFGLFFFIVFTAGNFEKNWFS